MTRSFYYVPALLPTQENKNLFRSGCEVKGSDRRRWPLAFRPVPWEWSLLPLKNNYPQRGVVESCLGGSRRDCRVSIHAACAYYAQVPVLQSCEQH
jgi:hypothetical protein